MNPRAVSETAAARCPRLAQPFTILSADGAVSLVAGEDVRYTFKAPGLERWLPALLAKLDGRMPFEQALDTIDATLRDDARELLARMYSERILVDGTAADAHAPLTLHPAFEGSGRLLESLRSGHAASAGVNAHVLCQDRLDYDAALRFNARCLQGKAPWLWASYGPASRAYVSPLFLPRAGPCLACLLSHFKRLSPAPEFYDGLIAHARAGKTIEPAAISPHGLEVLKQLVLWKLTAATEIQAPVTLYRLHVLEFESLEVSTHRVFIDPECPACCSRKMT